MHSDIHLLSETLRNLPHIAQSYIGAIPQDCLDRRRGSDIWTVREHIYHLADAQQLMIDRIHLFRREEHPVIVPFFPDKQSPASSYSSLAEAFSVYTAKRGEQLLLISELSETDFAKTASHEEYSSYSLPVMFHHMIFHEYWHLHRIEAVWLINDRYLE